MKSNDAAGVAIVQPATLEERRAAARTLVDLTELSIPVVVDDVDDAVSRTFGGWPERIYVLDADGVIVYRGGMGPFDFRPAEARAFLEGWGRSQLHNFPVDKPGSRTR